MAPKVTPAQRRARLMARHLLSGAAAPAASVAAATEAMVALHATDPVTVYLSARARTPTTTVEAVDAAIYAERRIVRMLGMRRTVFVVPAALLPVVQRACTDDVAGRLRRQLVKDLEKGGVGGTDAAGWLRDTEAAVLRALGARGSATGAQLSADEPRLRTQLVYVPDKSYGGAANITSRVLGLIAAEGHMVRGHRRGGWSSGQFEWFPATAWLRGGAEADGAREVTANGGAGGDAGLDAAAARVELARRWLVAFGPAPAADLQWWAGWTGGQTKAALAALPVREVDLDGQPGVLLTGDEDFAGAPGPVAALLPALDPTPMGWQSRDWYLGPHGTALFDRTGNIGPTIWWEGRIVGGWAQRGSGEVAYRLLEDLGSDAVAAIAAEAARLESWLGPNRVTPRFRTPLERELSSLFATAEHIGWGRGCYCDGGFTGEDCGDQRCATRVSSAPATIIAKTLRTNGRVCYLVGHLGRVTGCADAQIIPIYTLNAASTAAAPPGTTWGDGPQPQSSWGCGPQPQNGSPYTTSRTRRTTR
ncbi:MAG TPA: winged helix DNA-binding domain-containing protein [Trebonia sp.]|nr:winged helix DNA-binding domain-containing protein [Trebonia sp.]